MQIASLVLSKSRDTVLCLAKKRFDNVKKEISKSPWRVFFRYNVALV